MTYKTKMFIDFQKQADTLDFSFNRMDINDVKIFSDALDLYFLNKVWSNEEKEFLPDRIKSIQAEFKTNIYTQNIRLPLIPPKQINPFAGLENKIPNRKDFDTWEEFNTQWHKYMDWEQTNN